MPTPSTADPTRPLKVGVQLPEVEREVRWPELLDMARAIEDLGYDSLWLGEHLLYRFADRPPRGPWEAWTLLAGLSPPRRRGGARSARRVHELPQPGAARQAGRHDRRDQRRALRPGSRGRLERDRIRCLRLPVRPPDRPVRGGVHDHPDASCATARSTSTAASTRPAIANCCRAVRVPAVRR